MLLIEKIVLTECPLQKNKIIFSNNKMSSQEIVDECYNSIKNLIGSSNAISAFTIIDTLLPQSMILVERYPNLPGKQKEEIVVSVITRLLDEIPLEDDLEKMKGFFVSFILPGAIALVIDVDKRKYVVNKVKSIWACCTKCCKK